MKRVFTVLLLMAVAVLSNGLYGAENSWEEAVAVSVKKVNDFKLPEDWFVPVVTDVIKGGEKARLIRVNISRLDELWLVADSNGSNGADHACWGSAVFIDAKGVKTPAVNLKPQTVKVGYGKLEKGKFAIGGGEFPKSLFTHAQSHICYRTAKKFKYFEAHVGIRSSAGRGGSVIFKVLADLEMSDSLAPLKRQAWDDLQKRYPRICNQLQKDFPHNRHFDIVFNYKAKTQELQAAMAVSLQKLGFDYSDVLSGKKDAKSVLADYGRIAKIKAKATLFRKRFIKFNPRLIEVFELDGSGFFRLEESVKDFDDKNSLKSAFAELKEQMFELEKEFVTKGATDPRLLERKGDVLLDLASRIADACGWPTFLADNRRSGYTPRRLKFPLFRSWSCNASAPSPAWPPPAVYNPRAKQLLSPTLTFDRALHTVGVNNRLFFGSSADNSVHCLDAKTGTVKWSFTCDGPVRIPPYLYKNRVYAGSDDGFVYCLDQKSGELLWSYSAGSKRMFIGNGRLISRLPIRCGLCVEDGKLYFTAGLFPSEAAYLIALDAETGKECWKEKIDSSPQGFLLSSPSRLFLPTGRTPFVEYNRATGKKVRQLGHNSPWGGNLVGGCRAVVIDENIVTGPSEGGHFHLFSNNPKEKIVRSKGLHLIVRGRFAYILDHDNLTAIDRGSYLDRREPKCAWKVPVKAPYAMIMAGDTIICGGDQRIYAFKATDGKKLWSAPVVGKALGLSVVDGRLVVSTDSGMIHSFTSEKGPESKQSVASRALFTYDKSADRLMKAVLQRGKLRKGYLCLAGIGDGKLLTALATSKEHDLRIACIDESPEKVEQWRQRLLRAGLYGSRVEIFQQKIGQVSLPSYFADFLINGDDVAADDFICLQERILRPAGGIACFVNRGKTLKLVNFVSSRVGKLKLSFYERPALPGTGEWPTTYGDGGNSACSKDNTVYKKPEILWFGRPGANHMIDRHDRNTPPLYKGAMMYISGMNYLFGINAYNGTVVWEKKVPHSARAALPKNCGNMVADDNALYIANGNNCSAFKSETGKVVKEYKVPFAGKDWAYVNLYKDRIIGSACAKGAALYLRDDKFDYNMIWYNNYVTCSDSFFAVSRKNGRVIWQYKPEGVIVNPAIAMSGKHVYFVETGVSSKFTGKGKYLLDDIGAAGTYLTAIDTTNGKMVWRQPIDTSGMTKVMFLSIYENTVLLSGSQHKKFPDRKRIRYELKAFNIKDGNMRWESSETPNYDYVLDGEHGEQTQHPTIVKGVVYGPGFAVNIKDGSAHRGWKWSKSHKCATVCSSNNFVFSRFTNAKTPNMFDLQDGARTELTKASRPGCWINMLPVGGLILIPEFSAGCTCPYSIQTSMALIPTETE